MFGCGVDCILFGAFILVAIKVTTDLKYVKWFPIKSSLYCSKSLFNTPPNTNQCHVQTLKTDM